MFLEIPTNAHTLLVRKMLGYEILLGGRISCIAFNFHEYFNCGWSFILLFVFKTLHHITTAIRSELIQQQLLDQFKFINNVSEFLPNLLTWISTFNWPFKFIWLLNLIPYCWNTQCTLVTDFMEQKSSHQPASSKWPFKLYHISPFSISNKWSMFSKSSVIFKIDPL